MSIHQQKMVRFTLDMPPAMHKNIKIACAEDGITMHAYMLQAAEKLYSDRADRIDSEIAKQSKKDILEHGTMSLEEMDQAMGA